ncbi:MAG: plastocyanin/azurin family copper-binding protein [Actinomycetota bacterium]
MRLRGRTAILIGVLLAAVGVSASASISAPVRTVVLAVRHSKFSVSDLEVKRGEKVRFVVRNEDPIDHELIVGPMPVQIRHESGREKWHPPIPGEVSVPLLETAETSFTFAERGTMWFGCHLPGHWTYGMQGQITVK